MGQSASLHWEGPCFATASTDGAVALPREALPLLAAVALAQRRGAIDESEGLRRMAVFAASVAEAGLTPEDIAHRAETEARVMLALAEVHVWYPGESSCDVANASARLSAGDCDAIDALAGHGRIVAGVWIRQAF